MDELAERSREFKRHKFRLAGKEYRPTESQTNDLARFIDEQWNLPDFMTDDKGRKIRVPTTVKALSFSLMLNDWAEERWHHE